MILSDVQIIMIDQKTGGEIVANDRISPA